MKHENEMAIGDLSSIHDNGHEDLMYNTNGV